MKTISKGDDIGAAFHPPGQFQGCLNTVGAGWAGELNLVCQIAGGQNGIGECFQEPFFGRRAHVQGVDDAVVLQIINHGGGDGLVVVAVVQRSGPGEEIYVSFALFIIEHGAF